MNTTSANKRQTSSAADPDQSTTKRLKTGDRERDDTLALTRLLITHAFSVKSCDRILRFRYDPDILKTAIDETINSSSFATGGVPFSLCSKSSHSTPCRLNVRFVCCLSAAACCLCPKYRFSSSCVVDSAMYCRGRFRSFAPDTID